jgi:hypothetical protein
MITIIVFVIGIYVGDSLNQEKVDVVENLNEDLRSTTLAIQTQFDLVNENPCEFADDTYLFKELLDVSMKVEYMENQLGQNSASVRRMKDYYSTLLIKHWLFTKRIKDECPDSEIHDIIYFYAPDENCPYCDSQGHILTNIRKDYPFVRVFPFDYTLDNPALNTLKKMYIEEFERYPIIIINGETHQGFMSRATLEKELGLNMVDEE